MKNNQENQIPVFAIVGHPNEGKSSVVSTLAEDDSVRVSPYPGETIKCMSFPVIIDHKEIIRFVDTPGFQNPGKTLVWMKKYNGADELILNAFLNENYDNPDFEEEIKLLTPIFEGACVIYVADGSRPLRNTDKMEMEILRYTGKPRMAILNIKENEQLYIDDWKREFLKNFNCVRIFNAHTATYKERIELLESLKAIHQDWQNSIGKVIEAFKNDWDNRAEQAADYIFGFLKECITYKIKKSVPDKTKIEEAKNSLVNSYKKQLVNFEKDTCAKIKTLHKHNIFEYSLPDYSILNEDLFHKKNLEILGLKPGQLSIAGGVAGGMIGAAVDGIFHGASLGLFMGIGGAAGAGYAYLNKNKFADVKVAGLKIGNRFLTIGPCRNIQVFYVLLDRILLFYSYTINWAHGKRDVSGLKLEKSKKIGFAALFSSESRKILDMFFSIMTGSKSRNKYDVSEKEVVLTIKKILLRISEDSFFEK